MITSTKNYTEKQKNKKWTDGTLRQSVKAKLYRQNHRKKHTYTVTNREKGKKFI